MPARLRCLRSTIIENVTSALAQWRNIQPAPWGTIVCDHPRASVVYVPPDVVGRNSTDAVLLEVAPALAVAIISPEHTLGQLHEMIAEYMEAGVALVWLIDPQDRTVTIYRPGEEPTFANARQELTGGDVLPGFHVPVARLFV